MNYAKKMMLVPLDSINRLQSQFPAATNNFDTLDNEMSKILELKGKSDYEKWQEYNQVLQQYLRQYEKFKEPIKVPIEEENISSSNTEQETIQPFSNNAQVNEHDIVLNSVLNTFARGHQFRNKAAALYGILKRTPDIKWDNNGSVAFRNQVVPGTNIVDLLNDVIRNRQGNPPVGWDQFAHVLSSINVPKEYIGNARRWEYISGLRDIANAPQRQHYREMQKRNTEVYSRQRTSSPSNRSRSRSPLSTKQRWNKFRL